MKNFESINKRAQKNTGRIQETQADFMRAFKKLQQEGYKANALAEKTKEFIALTYAVADKCEGCIGNHINKLVKLGATREEISDIVAVCIVMGGGPASVYGGYALEAYDEAAGEN